MLDFSPKGEVPVLIVDGEVIDESLDVMQWALKQSDHDNWLEPDGMAELVARFDEEFKPVLDRYKYADRNPERSQIEYREEATPYLKELDERLSNTEFLMGARLSFADVALFPFVRQFAHVDKVWFDATEYINLVRWLNNLLESDLFLSVMKKYPQWHDGDEVTYFIEEEAS